MAYDPIKKERLEDILKDIAKALGSERELDPNMPVVECPSCKEIAVRRDVTGWWECDQCKFGFQL